MSLETAQDFNPDQALANIEATGSADIDPGQPVADTPQSPNEYEYVWNGKTIKADIEKLKKMASMGHDYSQKMHEWNKKEADWKAKEQEWSTRLSSLSRWEEYQKFAESNPDWAEYVNQNWERRNQLTQDGAENPNHPLFNELQALKQELSPIKSFIGELQQQRMQEKRASEDKALSEEIASIRGKYKDIDFDLPDETGQPLEYRILEHAQKNGINSFKTAFHDYYHDNLIKIREDKAKEQVVKDVVNQRRSGILGTTQSPTKGLTQAQNARNKSYDDLAREAMAELGL